MSSTMMVKAWQSDVTGMARLALVALADHADARGEVNMSQRELADLCAVSRTRADTLIKQLVDTGTVTVADSGRGGRKPARYKITLGAAPEEVDTGEKHFEDTPESDVEDTGQEEVEDECVLTVGVTHRRLAEPVETHRIPDIIPEDFGAKPTATLPKVSEVLAWAGIAKDPQMPFYWARCEHEAALAQECRERGLTTPDSVKAFIADRRDRIREPGAIRSIGALFRALG